MIKVKNKVIFLNKPSGGINRDAQLSANVQGQLKKKITKVKKLKSTGEIKVTIKGSYKAYEVEIEPKDSPLASKIQGILKKRD